jgi:hypothetical protein
VPGRVAVDARAGTMPGPEGTGKTDCGGTGPIGMRGVTTAESGGRDRGCESADSRDATAARQYWECRTEMKWVTLHGS